MGVTAPTGTVTERVTQASLGKLGFQLSTHCQLASNKYG
jgi:hypothetical protein